MFQHKPFTKMRMALCIKKIYGANFIPFRLYYYYIDTTDICDRQPLVGKSGSGQTRCGWPICILNRSTGKNFNKQRIKRDPGTHEIHTGVYWCDIKQFDHHFITIRRYGK